MSSRVYKNQTNLNINLRAKSSLVGFSLVLIKFRRPNRTVGQWVAEVTDAENGYARYKIQSANDLPQTGDFTLWLDITFEDGTWLPGDPVVLTVCKPGTLPK